MRAQAAPATAAAGRRPQKDAQLQLLLKLQLIISRHLLQKLPPTTGKLAAAQAARFPYVGIGLNARAAWAPYITTIKGTRIAIIGVSQVAELAPSWVATRHRPGEANSINTRRTLAAVRAARKHADVVIVFMHWAPRAGRART